MGLVNIKRGEIVIADLDPVTGNEQGKTRPVLIIQNDISNNYSPVTIIAAITSKIYEKEFPTNVFLTKKDSGLDKDSTIMLNQIRTIDKIRISNRISSLDNSIMKKVDLAIKVSLGLD
ncbi:type II toxin-antitoxin system PemK/MazF family toxin [Candidatus Woesearchaeota archaeon]|nr:type II toxin-antitoxin system PemK/MazF family toxin [Candidatus Woesearchaeota archaeon]